MNARVFRPLIGLLKSQVVNVQIKAAVAIEAVVDLNETCQVAFLAHDAAKELIRFLKVLSLADCTKILYTKVA